MKGRGYVEVGFPVLSREELEIERVVGEIRTRGPPLRVDIITKRPQQLHKSSDGGDYFGGIVLLDPDLAFDYGLIDGEEAKKLHDAGLVVVAENHLLYSAFEDQGWTVTGYTLQERAKEIAKFDPEWRKHVI